ncbi:MAG TPA: adenylate/guanylate cyclase domain-containing protein, partial [Solirubrobacteraceae bacterium]|nr:adenylate/guanylate cyclase domain-containing protein [Solirubrobacteraceae bacterium]
MAPETRYARSGGLHIAYQTFGDGPLDILWVPTWIWEGEHVWEEPSIARLFKRVGNFGRLITFDRRGSGLSDSVEGAPTLEEQMDDVVAVLDAVGAEEVVPFAQLEAGAMACLFAATHPERTRALVLYEATPRMTKAPDYDWPLSKEEREVHVEQLRESWGSGEWISALSRKPPNDRLKQWAGRLERLAASPGTAVAFYRMHSEVDVRPVLPSIQAPTLVLHRPGDQYIDIRHSLYLAEHIPGARMVELSGHDTLLFTGDQDELLAEVEEFLTGARHAPDPERILATVMFSDIVDSTRRAAELGDRRWRDLLESMEESVGRELARFRGRAVKSMGDGFLATFDGPARGIRCATAVRDAAQSQFGIEIRTGLHTGEVEVMGNDLGGIAVHIGARVGAA